MTADRAYEAPSLSLLSKLGSIIIHTDEFLSSKGHQFDKVALEQLIADAEVQQWLKAMGPLVPVKR